MLINPLIRNDYITVKAFQGTSQVRKMISNYGSALVISEEAGIMGVITAYDLATRQHNLVIDCLTAKPVISRHHLIPEVLALMEQVHSDLLMVYEDGELIGVIHKKDITDYLCRSVEQQRSLVHSIAHDLKNPLSNVLSITYLMEDTTEDEMSSDNRELISVAQDACKYATGIINDLLFSEDHRSETLNRESLEINELMRDCMDSFKIPLLKKQINLTSRFLPAACYMEADRIKLKRAFSNLLSNAVKFTPSGGTITIMAEKAAADILITIKDSGIGIPAELQPQVFKKFTDAKRLGTGGESSTGLGMYITRQIIENHGGKIWLESQDQQGTAIYVQLSLVQ